MAWGASGPHASPRPRIARILRQPQVPRARTAAPARLAEMFRYVLPEGRDEACAVGTLPRPIAQARPLPIPQQNHLLAAARYLQAPIICTGVPIHARGHLLLHGGTHTPSGFAFRFSLKFWLGALFSGELDERSGSVDRKLPRITPT